MSRVRVVVLSAVMVLFGWVVNATPGAVPAPRSGDPVNGLKIYTAQKCSLCHKIGATGGKLGPDLSAVGAKRDALWFAKYLVNPKIVDPKNKMPAVKVKGQELDDLIAYLHSLGKK